MMMKNIIGSRNHKKFIMMCQFCVFLISVILLFTLINKNFLYFSFQTIELMILTNEKAKLYFIFIPLNNLKKSMPFQPRIK